MAIRTAARRLEVEENAPRTGYREIAAVLYARVRDGRYKPGAKIPTEAELCAEFAVARVTIRRALAILIDERALESRQGAGTFVPSTFKPPPPNIDIKLVGPQRGVWQEGDMFTFLGSEKTRALKADQDFYGTHVRSVEQFRYLRLRHQVPVDVATFEYADWVSKLIIDRSEAVLLHLNPYLQERGIIICRSRQSIGAAKADKTLARHLGVPVGEPLVRVRSLSWDQNDKPVARGTWHHRADMYEMELEVSVGHSKRHGDEKQPSVWFH